jgi:hypothetical protein
MQERNMTNAEFQQQMNTFNAAAQNYATVLGTQFQQQAGLAREAAGERVATQEMLTQNQRDIAEMDANLKAQGMTSNQRIAAIGIAFNMDATELSALMQGSGQNLDWLTTEARIESAERMQEQALEASESSVWDYISKVAGPAGDVLALGQDIFGDKDKKPTTTTPTTTPTTTQAPTGRTGPLSEEEFY